MPEEAEAWARYESDDKAMQFLVREGDTAPNYPRLFIVNGKAVATSLALLARPYTGAPPSAVLQLRPWEVVLGVQRLGHWLKVLRFAPPLVDAKQDGSVVPDPSASHTSDAAVAAWARMRQASGGAVQLFPYPLPGGYCSNDRDVLCDASRPVDPICSPLKPRKLCRLSGGCAGADGLACSRESDCGDATPCLMLGHAAIHGRCHLKSEDICLEDGECLGEDDGSTAPCVTAGVCNHDMSKRCRTDEPCRAPGNALDAQADRQCIFGRCSRLSTVGGMRFG